MNGGRLLLIMASVAMAAAVLGGLHVMGSPAHQRKLRLDDRRISALSIASNVIHRYWTQHDALPDDLSAVDIQAGWQNDPVTGKPYVYKRLSDDSYSLCASFDTASDGAQRIGGAPYIYGPTGANWKHPAGTHCFRFMAESQGSPSE
jgi:hypothetical protein